MISLDVVRARLYPLTCLAGLTLVGCVSTPHDSNESALWTSSRKSKIDQKDLKDPKSFNLAYARWQEQSGKLVDARDSYESVLKEDSRSVDAVLGMARIDSLAGRKAEAESGYQKALKHNPNDPRVLDAVGQFYSSEQRWNESLAALNAAMLAEPENKTYRYHLAIAMARSGNVNGAVPHFVRTVGDAVGHYNVGYILYEQGKLQEAEQHLLQAVIKQPNLNQAQVMLNEVRGIQADRTMLAGRQSQPPGARPAANVATSPRAPRLPAATQTAAAQYAPQQYPHYQAAAQHPAVPQTATPHTAAHRYTAAGQPAAAEQRPTHAPWPGVTQAAVPEAAQQFQQPYIQPGPIQPASQISNAPAGATNSPANGNPMPAVSYAPAANAVAGAANGGSVQMNGNTQQIKAWEPIGIQPASVQHGVGSPVGDTISAEQWQNQLEAESQSNR